MRKRYPEVPWKEMTGIRDKLVHGYFGVNLEVVWRTVKEDLPPLEKAIKKVLDDMKPVVSKNS